MNTEMADGAAQRCAAQIGEALFGQPGMTLVEIANRRAEIERMVKDAGRYRWLRNDAHKVDEMSPAVLLAEAAFPVDNCHTAGFVFGDELDEQVDAAMKEQAG